MNYEVNFERELDLTQLSIANTELCSVLSLIEKSRNNEVEFYKYIGYAKQLQKSILEIELELKNKLRGT